MTNLNRVRKALTEALREKGAKTVYIDKVANIIVVIVDGDRAEFTEQQLLDADKNVAEYIMERVACSPKC